MADSMSEVMNPSLRRDKDPAFPFAPPDWSKASAETTASDEGVALGDDHWETLRALQEYFARKKSVQVRELHDALEEKFHAKGGLKFLYGLFPGGPVAQGCRFTPVDPISVAVAAETMLAPMATPASGFLATHTGGMVSASLPE